MRHWTPEERARQAELIKQWKPWKKAGVKTPEGKAVSCMNARKHGMYSAEHKALLRELRQYDKVLHDVRQRVVESRMDYDGLT